MHSFAPERGHDLGVRVELDAEAAVVEARERLAELRAAAVRRVLVRARVAAPPRRAPRRRASGVGVSGSPMPRLITSTPGRLLLARSCARARRTGTAGAAPGAYSARMQLLHELVAELAAVDGHGPAGQVHVQVLPHLDLEVAAVEVHGHRAVDARAARRPRRRRWRRCRTTSSPPPRARRSAPGSRRRRRGRQNDTLVRFGNSSWRSIGGPSSGRSSSSRPVRPPRSRTAGCRSRRTGSATRGRRPRASPPVVAARREVLRGQLGPAHVDRAGGRAGDARADLAGRRLDRERVAVGPAVAAQVHDRLAHAVAGQLGLRAVGVEDAQLRRRSRAPRAPRAAARRRSRCRCAARRAPGLAPGVSSNGSSRSSTIT